MKLEEAGWDRITTSVHPELLKSLAAKAFADSAAGTRCLLDLPEAREVVLILKEELIGADILPPSAVAIQAIAFDKTPGTNWKVAWHQDLMFPFARTTSSEGFAIPSRKGGVDYARPPLEILEQLLAVRLHLDDCGADNGPLRICEGSHRAGIISPAEAAAYAARHGETACLADRGEAILMKPLLLHASSQAASPRHRRVLHFVFHNGARIAEEWHRHL